MVQLTIPIGNAKPSREAERMYDLIKPLIPTRDYLIPWAEANGTAPKGSIPFLHPDSYDPKLYIWSGRVGCLDRRNRSFATRNGCVIDVEYDDAHPNKLSLTADEEVLAEHGITLEQIKTTLGIQ